VLIFGVPLVKHKGIAKEDDLAIEVFHHDDEESLHGSMNLFVPTEIWQDG